VVIADAVKPVGRKVKGKRERVQPGVLYATLTGATKAGDTPVTAEGEAEKPTRAKPAAKKAEEAVEPEVADVVEAETDEEAELVSPPVKKKTRRGTRGGRKRKKPATAAATAVATNGDEPVAPTIHVPSEDLGRDEEPVSAAAAPAADLDAVGSSEALDLEVSENGTKKPRKKTRRGSRGGKNRRKKPAGAPATTAEPGESS